MHKNIEEPHWKSIIQNITSNYAKKSLGQCFLYNQEIIKNIIIKCNPQGNIVEIGGGSGIFSYYLLKNLEEGGFLTVIEKDERFIGHLNSLLNTTGQNNFSVLNTDALNFATDEKCHMLGNLPYNIATILLYNWFEKTNYEKITVMLQKEVAQKIICNQKNKNPLHILAFLTGTVKKVMDLSPNSFHPAPKVQSQVIHYTRENKLTVDQICKLKDFLNIMFKSPRKTIENNLKDNEKLLSILKNIDSEYLLKRPGELSIKDYEKILLSI